VLELVSAGLNDSQISRATGISRTTVRTWRRGQIPGRRRRGSRDRAAGCPRCVAGVSLDEPAYAYLLGLYLGDGHIAAFPRTFRLRIVQDARYPHLIALAGHAMSRILVAGQKVSTVPKPGCVEVGAYWNHWPCLFPQHGAGRKHHRSITLAPWQADIVRRYPRQLIRGLIHSDGCRTINRVIHRRYAYVRYFFTNSSEDIQQIFRDACAAAGIEQRNSKPNTISIARRQDVAALESFIGPKA
jgi:hypothetical protein